MLIQFLLGIFRLCPAHCLPSACRRPDSCHCNTDERYTKSQAWYEDADNYGSHPCDIATFQKVCLHLIKFRPYVSLHCDGGPDSKIQVRIFGWEHERISILNERTE